MKKAFTLIELLLVIVLMGIMLGMAVPMFSGMSKGAEMKGAVRSLSSTISLTRQWAITHKETVGVIVDEHTFFAVSMDKTSGTVSGSDILNGRVNVDGKLLGKDIVMNQGQPNETRTTLYGKIKKIGTALYFVTLAGDKANVSGDFTIYNNISDPVAFDGVLLKMKANGAEANGLTFRTTGGLKDEKDYTIEMSNVQKPDVVVKTITVNWLVGSVRVED
jgi:prepilin-type N-terminal cleavage/methylation domain-containing protein